MKHEFKVGDKVRRISLGAAHVDGFEGMRVGDVGTVTDTFGLGGCHGLCLKEFPGATHESSRLELVTSATAEQATTPAPTATDANPKTIMGAQKPDLSLAPPVASLHMAMAFEDGARKYGPYNWREKAVPARTYLAAAKRHIDNFLDGEERTSDTNVHNLGAAMASLAIILDAAACGMLIDDRPKAGASSATQEALKAEKKARAEQQAIADAQHAIASGPFAEPSAVEAAATRAGRA